MYGILFACFGSSVFIIYVTPRSEYSSVHNILGAYPLAGFFGYFTVKYLLPYIYLFLEYFNLSGLFLSDHIPSIFQIIDQTVEIDESPVDFIFSGAQNDMIYPGYSTYHWTLDSPVDGELVNNLLHSGENLTIRYWAVSTDIGNYTFPLHSACFVADGEGYFVISDSLEVRVVISSGIDDDPETNNLLPNFIISTAYPNPFNAEVRVQYEGKGIGGQQMEFEIYNVLGQKVQTLVKKRQWAGSYCVKFDGSGLAGGLYLYQLKIAERQLITRKMLILK